jgi:hypothetical protein
VPHWAGALACAATSGALLKSEGSGTEKLSSLQVIVVVGGDGVFLAEQLGIEVVFAEQIVGAATCSTLAIDIGVGGEGFVGSRCGCGSGGGSTSGFGVAADRQSEGKESHCVVLWWCECCTGLWCYQK